MQEIRTLFNYGKEKITQCVGNIKSSITTTTTEYTLVSIGKSVFVEDTSKVEQFATGLLYGFEKGADAVKTENYLQFAASLFQDLSSLKIDKKKSTATTNGSITQQEDYLLSFIVIQSQNSILYNRALNLLHRAQILCNGILDPKKTSVDSTIFDQGTMNEMLTSVSAKLPINKKIAFKKEDALKAVSLYSLKKFYFLFLSLN